MDQNVSKHHVNKLVGQRNYFLFFSGVLSIAVVLLSCLLLFKKERIVIVPTSGMSYWIEEGKVSSGYVEKMGLFLSDLLLNRSPADVEKRNEIILQHVHPSAFHEMRKLLQQEQKSILQGDQAFFFRSEKSFIDMKSLSFVIEGGSYAAIGKEGKDPSFTQQHRKKYTLRFTCENGKLYLTSLKKEEG